MIQRVSMNFKSAKFVLLLTLLTYPAIAALLVHGFYGASDDIHIAWLFEMDRALKAGEFPPRYVPDLSFGFGYPLFNFVFPLPFYVGEIFHLFGLSFVASIKAVFLLSLLVSGYTMYYLLRYFLNEWMSLAGALMYVYTPYRSTDTYVRGALGEAVAFVFFPLITLSVIKITEENIFFDRRVLKWIGLGALSLAGLILSHDIASYMFMPFILCLGLTRILLTSKKVNIISLGVMFVLGLLGSIYFWLPALLDSRLMKYDTVFDFFNQFPTILQLITPYWGYGGAIVKYSGGMSFFIGHLNLLIFPVAIIGFLFLKNNFSKSQLIILFWVVLSILFSFFMMNYRSTFIWNTVPLLPYFQFPWRFLMMTTFLSPLLLIVIAKFKYNKVIAIVLGVAALFINYSFFHPHDFLGRTDAYYINRYIPVPVASEAYKQTKEEYLRLPLNTQVRPDKNYPRIFNDSDAVINLTKINSMDSKLELSSAGGVTLSYNKYFFPGWSGVLDGKSISLQPGKPFGQITATIPPGKHILDISFSETPFKILLDVLSLIGLIGGFMLTVKSQLFINPK